MLLPNGMDGVGGLTQPAIAPGETFSTSSRCASTAR
jgi:FtsP/CotA-like multicopper oxidase with cupredoxin domain